MTVAARLVKDPCISVLVLEAGEPNLGDPKILLGGQLGATYGDPKVCSSYRVMDVTILINLLVRLEPYDYSSESVQ